MNYYYNELIQGITVRYDSRVCNFQFKKLSSNRCTIAFDIDDNTWLDFNNDELYEMMDYLLAQKFIQDLMERINNGSFLQFSV